MNPYIWHLWWWTTVYSMVCLRCIWIHFDLYFFHSLLHSNGLRMSQKEKTSELYKSNFSDQLISCLRSLNATTDPRERFDTILRLQAAYNILRARPQGSVPHDPQLVWFVGHCQNILDHLYLLEHERNHFYCEQLKILRDLNNRIQQPQPPLPPTDN